MTKTSLKKLLSTSIIFFTGGDNIAHWLSDIECDCRKEGTVFRISHIRLDLVNAPLLPLPHSSQSPGLDNIVFCHDIKISQAGIELHRR